MMSSKKHKIAILTLTLFLLGSTAVYAYTMSGYTTISPGVISVTSLAYTATDTG